MTARDRCTSCNATLAEPGSTRFPCPLCGYEINRCHRCREQSIVCMPEVRVPGAITMGNVALILKIMPESPDVDREALKEAIRAAVTADDIQEEPIGFGLVALKVAVVVPDRAGAPDEVERALQKIEGVGSVDIIESTLV